MLLGAIAQGIRLPLCWASGPSLCPPLPRARAAEVYHLDGSANGGRPMTLLVCLRVDDTHSVRVATSCMLQQFE